MASRLSRHRLLLAAAGCSLLAAGFAVGWFLRGDAQRRRAPTTSALVTRLIREQDDRPWRFINPLLECETTEEFLLQPELDLLRNQVRQYIRRSREEKRILQAAVFFRELREGSWFGVGMRRGYAPASLLKLPALITVLKLAETDPELLQRKLLFDGTSDLNRLMFFKPQESLQRGREYTVEELCRIMASRSDNNATELLSRVTREEYDRTLKGLGLFPELTFTGGHLSIKSVSGIFRVLYNASYLNEEMSELALEMLSHSSFRQGLIAGIPQGVTVCSKYGEAMEQPQQPQLHEFAMVYHADNPYLLGVMVEGNDYAKMLEFLREVSRIVYAEVNAKARRRDLFPHSPGAFVDSGGLQEKDE